MEPLIARHAELCHARHAGRGPLAGADGLIRLPLPGAPLSLALRACGLMLLFALAAFRSLLVPRVHRQELTPSDRMAPTTLISQKFHAFQAMRSRAGANDPLTARAHGAQQPRGALAKAAVRPALRWGPAVRRPGRGPPRAGAVVAPLSDGDGEEDDDSEATPCDPDEDEECPAPQDYYELLNVDKEASPKEIKSAYRTILKSCHPDIAGDEANEVCILANDAYDTLMDDTKRIEYDKAINAFMANLAEGYTGRPLSKWGGDDPGRDQADQRGVFVDENQCIGCKMCANIAPGTFFNEGEWGRARVHTQWGSSEDDISAAIESCPVDCIYFVKKRNLPVLEWCMTQAERVGVAVMLGGSTPNVQDPFQIANEFIAKGDDRRERLRNQGIRDDDEWWGTSDLNMAFTLQMKRAWSQLRNTTKEAWTFYLDEDDLQKKNLTTM